METESPQKQEGPTGSLDKLECQMQREVDTSLDPAVLDKKASGEEPVEDADVLQEFKDQGQTEDTMTELVQAPHNHIKSPEEPDEFKKLISQGAFLKPPPKDEFSSLEVEVPECPSDDKINPDNNSLECYRNEDGLLATDSLLRSPETVTHQFPLNVPSTPLAVEKEETNTCSSNPALDDISSNSQQGELLPQGQHELIPMGAKQEAAQQVLQQNSAPLSRVSMEPPNQGGAFSKGSLCVVTVRERQADWARGKREGECKAEEQKQSRNKVDGQEPGERLVSSSELIQEEKREDNRVECPKAIRMKSDDNQSDSELSADFFPHGPKPKETPIEREIRRAIEREHSLRRSRGLPNATTEYVDIPMTKTMLNQDVSAKSEKFQSIDRELAEKMMQHEIHEDVNREQALVKLGKVPGFYDKGTVRQLKEKKELFEAFQKPSESSLSVSSESSSSSSSSSSCCSDSRDEVPTRAAAVQGWERRQSIEPLRSASVSSTPRGLSLSEEMSCQVIIVEKDASAPQQKHHRTNGKVDGHVSVDREACYVLPSVSGGHSLELDAEEMFPKENPFFKLRSLTNDVKVEQDIREAQEREEELRKQRISLYGAVGGGGSWGPVGLERSVQASVLQYSTSSPSGGSRPIEAHQSVGKLHTWPPSQDHGDTVNQPKVVQASHGSRHKTPLVDLWESGMVNGKHQQEQ
ncbi:uncharacterized protein misp3 [Corythoichthys intestinalis]|uniref:uncharacterized protein misp3 n=1 Tax=Corythoichthys intestinalis TaxID=161448 RepID=UPI0025A64964|nr:uncharacterized protein misp3 [Corythoichthys intestinalis]XP_057698523.1 uncharacterized protein misp3 [Corythoichthys intestinalis]